MSLSIRYTQLNIGCLSRNKFWGEPNDKAFRSAVCTSTLIELQDGSFMLVDPGLPYDLMADTIFNRRGVTPDKLIAIFLTHFHRDHTVDLDCYEHCKFFASKEEIALNSSSLPIGNIDPLEDQIKGISPVLLPGHTLGITGLGFISNGVKVLVAGDIVMTKDFYLAEEGFFNTIDVTALKESIRYARKNFDIIVPGHDVQFPTNVTV